MKNSNWKKEIEKIISTDTLYSFVAKWKNFFKEISDKIQQLQKSGKLFLSKLRMQLKMLNFPQVNSLIEDLTGQKTGELLQSTLGALLNNKNLTQVNPSLSNLTGPKNPNQQETIQSTPIEGLS